MQGRAHRHGQGRTAKDARLLHLSGPRRSGESSAGVFPSRQVVDCLCGPDPPSTALCVRVQQCARGARARVSEGKGVRGVCVCETQMDPTTERHACGPMAPTVGRAQAGGGGGLPGVQRSLALPDTDVHRCRPRTGATHKPGLLNGTEPGQGSELTARKAGWPVQGQPRHR